MKKQSDLSRLMSYAGIYRYFTYASWVLSAISALVALMPHRLLFSNQQSRAVQHQPFGFLGCHKFARGRIDQLYTLIAHVPELLDKRLHITVSVG